MAFDRSLTARRLALVGLLILAAFASTRGVAGSQVEGWTLERREWSRSMDGVERLHLYCDWGDVRVEGVEGERADLVAAVQQREGDEAEFEVAVERRGSELVVVVGFTGVSGEDPDPRELRRADVALSLPARTALEVVTKAGLIEVRELAGRAMLTSDRGRVDFVGAGGLTARTESGDVRALFRSSSWGANTVSVTTGTGDIRIELLEGAAATVTIETRGAITTDYSIDIRKDPEGTRKTATARIAGGGPAMSLVSQRGAVRLISLIVPESVPSAVGD